jgi:hypothetical protein
MEATFTSQTQLPEDDPQPVDTVSSAVAMVSEPVQTSATKKTAKKKRPSGKGRLSKAKRVRVAIGDVSSSCEDTAITSRLPQNAKKGTQLHGVVLSGGSKQGWTVKLDILGVAEPSTIVVQGKKLAIVDSSGAGPASDDDSDDDFSGLPSGEVGSPPQLFADMSAASIQAERLCKVPWGQKNGGVLIKEDECIVWDIHTDDDRPCLKSTPTPQRVVPILSEINFSLPLHSIFFKHLFPDVTGHARRLDMWASDPRCDWHKTYHTGKMKFEEAGPDPDAFVKQCYLVLIAGTTETETGVENMWKRGPSSGRKMYPDSGRYAPENMFSVFVHGAIYAFVDAAHWFQSTYTWAPLQAYLDSLHARRKILFKSVFAVLLDESMIGWRPKSSKTGGLPNITFEPRKPKSLGTMLRNGADPTSGVILFHLIVKSPDFMSQLKYFNELSSLPDGAKIGCSTSECLREAEAVLGPRPPAPLSTIPTDDEIVRFVGGDAWFGSVMTCVTKEAVGRRLNLYCEEQHAVSSKAAAASSDGRKVWR